MQQVWKGGISFGLVNIPVRLYAATSEGNAVSFHQVHREDGGRIRYRRVCELDGEEVPQNEIARGVKAADGRTVVITDQDLENLPLPTQHTIEVVSFVPADQIDPVQLGRAYYLQADAKAGAEKPYVLLREAMAGSDRIAVVRIALRQREHLATLRAQGKVLVLQMLMWPDEVRSPTDLAPPADFAVRGQEQSMAGSLVESMAADFHPEQHTDRYREAVNAMVDAKAAGQAPPEPEQAEQQPDNVVDLMSALKESLEAAGRRPGGRGGTGSTRRASTRKRATSTPSADSKGRSSRGGTGAGRAKAASTDGAEGGKKTSKGASKKTTAPRRRSAS